MNKDLGLYRNIADKESRMSTLDNSLKSEKVHIRLGLGLALALTMQTLILTVNSGANLCRLLGGLGSLQI